MFEQHQKSVRAFRASSFSNKARKSSKLDISTTLQVLRYSKCRRNGSSGFRHSLGYGDNAQKLLFFQQEIHQLLLSSAAIRLFSSTFIEQGRKICSLSIHKLYFIPFLQQICDLFSFIIRLKFLSFHKYGVLLKTSVHVNKPDIHTFYLAFWRKCADRRIQIQTKPVLTLCY